MSSGRLFSLLLLFVIAGRYEAAALPLPAWEHTLFFDDFEAQMLDPSFWTLSGDTDPIMCKRPGEYCVLFQAAIPEHQLQRVELSFQIDLAGYESAFLSFRARKKGGLLPPPEQPFEGGCDGNGVALSLDGYLWHPIHDLSVLPESYELVVIDLDAALATWGLSNAGPIHIRFFFYVQWESHSPDYRMGQIDNVQVVGFPQSVHNYGHAPDPPYPSMRISDGARHVTCNDIMLGAVAGVDHDAPGAMARRDGVLLPEHFVVGETSVIHVTVPTACKLDAWFDFYGHGYWTAAEKVFDNMELTAGTHALEVAVPANAVPSDRGYARFRVSSAGGLEPTGESDDGEVEDYPFVLRPNTPAPAPLPQYSSGFVNTIEWAPMSPGNVYQVQRSLDAGFDVIAESSGWISDTTYTFEQLEDEQTHFYRVRAGREMPAHQQRWRHNRATHFLEGTATDICISDAQGVRLAPAAYPGRSYNFLTDDFESSDIVEMPVAGGFMNVFNATQDLLLHEWAVHLEVMEDGPVTFVVIEGGTTHEDNYYLKRSITKDAAVGRRFFSTGMLDAPLALSQGLYYGFYVSAANDIVHHMINLGHREEFELTEYIGTTWLDAYPTSDEWQNNMLLEFPSFMRLTAVTDTDHKTFGEYTSPVITREAGEAWATLHYAADVPTNTTLEVAVLPESGTNPLPGYGYGVASGADLSGAPTDAIRLRARLESSDAAASPALLDWQATRVTGEPYYLKGGWSEAVSSMQVNTPPSVSSITLLDETPTRAASARFLLVFSQPVTIAPEALNSDLYVDAPSAAAEITAIEGDGAQYVITAATGDASGTLKLVVSASDHIENAFGLTLTDGYDVGPAYVLDFVAPTVESVTRRYPEVPDAWPVAWRVTFSEPVFHVSEADFSLTGLADAHIAAVQGVGAVRDVYMQPGATEGVVALEVVTGGDLVDQVGWPLAAPYTDSPAYTVDFEAPYVVSISRVHPEIPATEVVAFAVSFSEPVYDVSLADFELTGMANAELLSVSGSGTVYAVNIIAGDMDGDARLDVVVGGALRDWAGRPLREDYRDGPAYLFDLYPPRVYGVALLDPPITNRPVVRFQVQFNKDVYDLEAAPPFSDFTLAGTVSAAVLSVTGENDLYTVSVDAAASEGTLRLDVSDAGPLRDHLGRGLAQSYHDGPEYQIQWLRFIETPPESITHFLGDTLTLRVISQGGTDPISYQWFKSGDGLSFVPIMGADAPLLTLNALDWEDAGYYYCEAADFYQSAVSPVTKITVEEIPLGSGALFWKVATTAGVAFVALSRQRKRRP